jgi:predicted PurR-regulated permease PerM
MKIEKLFLPSLIIFAIIWFLFTIKSILSPFIFSAIIAYLFNPIIKNLEFKKIPRSISSFLIIILFFAILTVIFTNLLPILFQQLVQFLKQLPLYVDNLLIVFSDFVGLSSKEELVSQNNLSQLLSFSDNIFGNIANSTNMAIDVVAAIAITPIISFYFLKDWNKVIKFIDGYLPSKYKKNIKKIIIEIDEIISKYLHGQLSVCLILGLIYAISLHHLELNYGFLIGFVTGILVFIPYVGMLIGVVASYIIALFQWGFSPYYFALIALIFIVGQVAESNYFTPKLVGGQIGIHPIWIIFGLFAFGILFGFVGLLLAIPFTAISKILLQHFGEFYKKKYVKN